jgi:putative redox protein
MDLITVTREEGLRFKFRIRDHEIFTDMSVEEGGQDSGPNPVEMLGGALGACMGIMLQMHCDECGYTDGDVSVSLTLEIVDDPRRVSGLVVDVELPKDVPEGDREELKKMAFRMPVPATLRDGPRIDIEMY